MSEVNTGGPTIQLQIVDTRTLRKLHSRIEKLPQVNSLLEEIVNQPFVVTNETAQKLVQKMEGVLGVRQLPEYDMMLTKKVKENAHMTAYLREIKTYMENGDFNAARKTIMRLVEASSVIPQGKPKDIPTVEKPSNP